MTYVIEKSGQLGGHTKKLYKTWQGEFIKDYFDNLMDDINDEFQNTDVALIIGANDVVNPAARTKKDSPLYGMPILNVDYARTVMFVKRSMGAGFAGEANPLFFDDKTMMVFGDAKAVVTGLVKSLKEE